jgi:hypothetical protein
MFLSVSVPFPTLGKTTSGGTLPSAIAASTSINSALMRFEYNDFNPATKFLQQLSTSATKKGLVLVVQMLETRWDLKV